MIEKQIERRLAAGVKELGGKAYKFISPGNAGVPDRLVLLPGGVVKFVELKNASGRLRPVQKLTIKEMVQLGAEVHTLYSVNDVEKFLKGLVE